MRRSQEFDCRQHIRASTFHVLRGGRLAMLRPDWLTLLWAVWAMLLIAYVIYFV